jgi:hypothetical protein
MTYTETVTVEELFKEELEQLQEQHKILVDSGSEDSLRTAREIESVIRYFQIRLGLLEQGIQEAYAPTDPTLH